jgi:hypothetical protein
MDRLRSTRRLTRSQPARKIRTSSLEMTAAIFGLDAIFHSALWRSRSRPRAVRRMKRRYLQLAGELLQEIGRAA